MNKVQVEELICETLAKYSNVGLTRDLEDYDYVMDSLAKNNGRCPCNGKKKCGKTCKAPARIDNGDMHSCGCGLFVRINDGE